MALAIFLLLIGLGVTVLGYRMKKEGKKVRGTIIMVVAAVPLFVGVIGSAVEMTTESTTESTTTESNTTATETTNATTTSAPTTKPKETPKATSNATSTPKPTPTPTPEPTLEELALDGLKDLPKYTVKAYIEGDTMPAASGNMNCTSKKCYHVVFDVEVGTPEEKTLDKNLDTIKPLGMDAVSTYEVMYWAKGNKKLLDATFR